MLNKLVSHLASFNLVSQDELHLIRFYCQPASFREGEFFLRQGEVCDRIGFVVNGVFRVYVTTEAGDEVTCNFMDEDRFITNLEPFHQGIPATESIQACTAADVIIIPKKLFHKLEQMDEKWVRLVHTVTEKTLTEKIRFRNSFLGDNATARYQKFLLQRPEVAKRVPLSYIASYLGIIPQSLSRIRKSLQAREQRRQVA